MIRGLVRDWPVVGGGAVAGRLAPLSGAVRPGWRGGGVFGPPDIAGKYFYGDGLDGFNFVRRRIGFGAALDAMIAALGKPDSETIYMGSLPVEDYLPGFVAENPMPLVAAPPRIWLGHASEVSAHYDTVDNLACVVAGTRRFTLYAPELIPNLYVGPIDNTMAGQPVSLAASSPPDDVKYPLFRDVRDQALVADLGPGDALYLPKLWWHQVVSQGPLNGLVNYWWGCLRHRPRCAPYGHAAGDDRDQPSGRRRSASAWRAFFDHYVFREKGHPLAHLPPEQHGVLGPLKENYGRLRARIMQMMREGRG